MYNYARATEDFDLGADIFITELRALDRALKAAGYTTELREPDEDDDLGGVIDIRRHAGDPDYVQVVNFRNPHRLGHSHPGQGAVARPDILELLDRNPDVDYEEIEQVARGFALDGAWSEILRSRSGAP